MTPNELQKVYQIHLCLNQAMFLFEELSEDNQFLIDNKSLYAYIEKLCEDLTGQLNQKQDNNYAYTLGKLKKAIEKVRIPKHF
jgi:hypothetical protein